MPRDAIALDNPALKDLPFSAGIRAGELIYFSGQIGLDPDANKLVDGGAGAETTQTMRNIAETLKAANKTLDDVVKANIYLADITNDYADMNAAYAAAFQKPYPARTCVGVAGLPLGARVEIEVIVR